MKLGFRVPARDIRKCGPLSIDTSEDRILARIGDSSPPLDVGSGDPGDTVVASRLSSNRVYFAIGAKFNRVDIWSVEGRVKGRP